MGPAAVTQVAPSFHDPLRCDTGGPPAEFTGFHVDWISSRESGMPSPRILPMGGPHGLEDRASTGSNFSWAWLSHTQSLYLEPLGSGEAGQMSLGWGQPAGSLLPPAASLSRALQKKSSVENTLLGALSSMNT